MKVKHVKSLPGHVESELAFTRRGLAFSNKMDNGSEEARHVYCRSANFTGAKGCWKNQESKTRSVLSTGTERTSSADNDVVNMRSNVWAWMNRGCSYFWIAETALSAPLPSGWYSADSEDGFTYFYNDKESTRDLPFTAVYSFSSR